jgi:hypothetical protein
MASKYTPMINDVNIRNVREQIARKKGYNPYYATTNQSTQVLTDYDTFPYPRYFRGVPTSSAPIVAEREAGWRPRHDNCYKVLEPMMKERNYPNHCFSAACSTVFPCYLENNINKDCIHLYR